MTKEKLLILCITYPEFSKKYYYRVCMAGITENGDLRRIYPIPIKIYQENLTIFEKYNWIEYDRLTKGNSRKESYKIDFKSIEKIESSNRDIALDLIKNKISNLENLSTLLEESKVSLGFIKPYNLKITIQIPDDRLEKKCNLSSQKTLFGGTTGDLFIPHHFKFDFLCSDSHTCKGHSIICEDIEYWKYFKKNLNNKNHFLINNEEIENDIINPLSKNPNLILMMGTHFRFKTWMVISVV